MADTTTGLPIKSLTGEFVLSKIVDTAGTNQAAVSAANALKVDGSAATQPVSIAATVVVDTELVAVAVLADNTTNPTISGLASYPHGFDGTTWDRLRTTDSSDGNAALTTVGILGVGVGPGFARRFNPANLGTAANSASAVDVNGAGTLGIEIGTATTGTFIIEATIDGTTWISAIAYDVSGAAYVTGTNITPAVGKVYVVSVNGMRQARLRTVGTLGATVAHVLTLSLGDTITIASPAGTALVDTELPAAAALTADAVASPTAPAVGGFLFGYNGTNWDRVRTANTGRLQVDVITGAGGTQYVGDAAATATPTGTMSMGLANAAAPTDVSANADAVAAWMLRNGSAVVNLASGGTLITIGQKAMTSSVPVVIASDQSSIVVDTELTAVAALADATANPTITNIAGYLMGFNGTTWDRVRTANTGRLQVDVITGGGSNASILVDNAGFTDGTSSVTTTGYIFDEVAGTALTENDVAAARIDSKRAQVYVLEDATTRGQRATVTAGNALKVDNSAVTQPSNISQFGGVNISATSFGPARLTDGTAYYTKTGQTAATAAFAQLSDQTNVANIIAALNALKVDISGVRGAADSASQALSVRLTDGTTFYTPESAPPVPKFSTQTSAALGAGANVTLTHYVTNTATGSLDGADVTSTVPIKIEIGTILTGSFTARVVAFALAGQLLTWRAPHRNYITRASADATTGFGVRITNKDAAVAADVYSTAYWSE